MGFYELGNGCDSCDTIQSILPNNVNMQMDPNSSLVSSMMMPYGTQGSGPKQYNGAISSGYAQGGSMGSMGTGSSGSSMGATPMVVQNVPVTTTTTQQVMKQVLVPGPAQVVVSNTGKGKVEGFTDSATTNVMSNDKMWIVLGLVIFTALAANECCKYFLNKSLQLNDGSPMYYVAYAGVAVLLTFAAYTYVSKN